MLKQNCYIHKMKGMNFSYVMNNEGTMIMSY